MLTIVVGLLTALSYTTSDLLSQRVTRGTRPLTQVVWVQATGVVIALPLALLINGMPHGSVEWHAAGFAALSGVAYFGAFFCLLQGLRVGDLGLVSALKSMEGAYAAVAFVLLGAVVTPLLGVALSLCILGAVLASMEGRAKTTRGAAWALASGMFFAGVMVCYRYAGDIHWLSQAAISRSVSLAIALPVALFTGSLAVPRDLRTSSVVAGILELTGVVLLTIALSLGPPTVAGVTAAQVGTFALILGVTLLHERPRRHQWAGVACTILGVSLLATLV